MAAASRIEVRQDDRALFASDMHLGEHDPATAEFFLPDGHADMTALIDTHDHGAVRELRLARPPVNALDPALCLALRDALAQAATDGIGGVVLAGGPKVFSAGLDVPHLLALTDPAALRAAWDAFFAAARALAAAPMPVVAAMSGHAPAGGCVLALCCDYRVMARGEPQKPGQRKKRWLPTCASFSSTCGK